MPDSLCFILPISVRVIADEMIKLNMLILRWPESRGEHVEN